MKIINPPSLPKPRGFNHGIVAAGSRLLFVAGQIGLAEAAEPGDMVDQFERALANVWQVVEAAGGTVEQVTRLTIYVTDMKSYLANRCRLSPAYRRVFGRHYPAMSLLEISGLIDPRALVEIEATAVLE